MIAGIGAARRELPPLGLLALRFVPAGVSKRVADAVMDNLAARQDSRLVRTVRANQAVVRGWEPEDARLANVVRAVLRRAGRSYVEWFRALAIGPREAAAKVMLSPWMREVLFDSPRPFVITGAHLDGFNLVILRLASVTPTPVLLAGEDPGMTHRFENTFRRSFGLHVHRADVGGLRLAVRQLRNSGSVMTGVDRPDPAGMPLRFFGRTARLSVGHVRLAARTGVPILVTDIQDERGGYRLDGTLVEVPSGAQGSEEDVRSVAQRVVNALEESIRKRPEGWLMFHPLWDGGTVRSQGYNPDHDPAGRARPG